MLIQKIIFQTCGCNLIMFLFKIHFFLQIHIVKKNFIIVEDLYFVKKFAILIIFINIIYYLDGVATSR